MIFYGIIQINSIQQDITKKITKTLANKLNTNISISSVKIKLFKRYQINDIYIEDKNKDSSSSLDL